MTRKNDKPSELSDEELIAATDYQGDKLVDGEPLEHCGADPDTGPGDGGAGGRGQIGDEESYEVPDVDIEEG